MLWMSSLKDWLNERWVVVILDFLILNFEFQKGVSDETITITNDRIRCEFTRQASLNDNDVTFFDLTGSNTYTVIMARSNQDLNNGRLLLCCALMDIVENNNSIVLCVLFSSEK